MLPAATLLRRLLCLAMAFTLVVPAAASGAHSLSHGQAGIAAAGEHGHPVSSDSAPAKDKQDGGHDHQLSLSVPVAALFGETPLVHPPLAAPVIPETVVKTLVLRPAEPPPADPPRTA